MIGADRVELVKELAPILGPLVSAVLVAVLNNWDKINPGKKYTKQILESVTQQKENIENISEQMTRMQSAQRTALQTQILEKCKRINHAIDDGDTDYSEELKQLIILYREYHLCGFNSQGKLYFNDTLARAGEHNPTLAHELMNMYFSEYNPT